MKKAVVEGEAQMLRTDAATIDVSRKWMIWRHFAPRVMRAFGVE